MLKVEEIREKAPGKLKHNIKKTAAIKRPTHRPDTLKNDPVENKQLFAHNAERLQNLGTLDLLLKTLTSLAYQKISRIREKLPAVKQVLHLVVHLTQQATQ